MNGNSFPEKIRRDIEESKKTLQELEKVVNFYGLLISFYHHNTLCRSSRLAFV
jgi:hypothetical protein